jgi:hypothetical protein
MLYNFRYIDKGTKKKWKGHDINLAEAATREIIN